MNEAERVVVPADPIDFAAMAWRTVIAGDPHIPKRTEMEVRVFLATLSDTLAGGDVLTWVALWRDAV